MKTIDIMLNNMTRSLRSAFLLAFMLAIPLAVTGLFYLMFGSSSSQLKSDDTTQTGPAIVAKLRLTVANLDPGDPAVTDSMAALPVQFPHLSSMGAVVIQSLRAPGLVDLVDVVISPGEEAAIEAVKSGQADAALVIPSNFSAGYAGKATGTGPVPGGPVTLKLYTDPAHPEKAGLAQAVLGQISDSLAGMKIAVMLDLAKPAREVTNNTVSRASLAAQAYLAAQAQIPVTVVGETHPQALNSQSTGDGTKPASLMTQVIAPIMGGMLIFFAFFTGGSTAQSILKEHEQGTLARLFTTPTPMASILAGNFAAVGLTVLGQVSVLLVAAHLIFGIQWGALGSVVMAGLGIVACAASFGIFLTSLLKTTRQGGMVFGGLLTITGMIGILGIFTGSSSTPLVSLFTPQGWAVRGLTLAMNGASTGQVALNLLALLVISLAFFTAGLLRFQKRFS